MNRDSRLLLGALLAALALLSKPAWTQLPAPIPLPTTDLSAYGAGVRAVLESGLAGVGELLEDGSSDPTNLAEAYGQLGRAALFYSQVELASACLRNAAGLRPDDYRWHYYLGVHYQNERDLENARASLARVLAYRPGDGATLVRLGQVLALLDEPEAATELFERIDEEEPWAAAALYGLGGLASARGDLKAAIRYFEAALERQPDAIEVRQKLGLAYRDVGDLEAAREHLTARGGRGLTFEDPLVDSLHAEFANSSVHQGMKAVSAGHFREAAAHYAEAVDGDPTNPVYRQALGGVLSALGDRDGAVEQLEEAVRLEPGKAMVRVSLALALAERDGFTDEVAEHFRMAREQAPGLKDARLGPAEAYARLGRFEDAEAELEAELSLDPEDTDARLLWAEILLLQERGEEAVRQLERVLELEPYRPQVLLSYGRALASLEEDAAASKALQLVLAGEADAGQRFLAHLELARTLDRLGDTEKALLHYRHAAEMRPESQPAREALALALAESGRLNEAIDELQAAFASSEPQARGPLGLTLAALQRRDGRDAEAEALLRSLVEESPELQGAHFNLAVLLGRRGEIDGARHHLKRVLEIDPTDFQTYLMLSQLLASTQQFAAARATLEQAHRQLPDNLLIMRALTQLLVASPDLAVRDLPAALALALELSERQPAAEHSALVAIALVGAARFEEAVVWQTRAVAEAEEAGLAERELGLMRQDLERYRQEAGSGDS